MSKIVTLKDTKITIEIEALALPDNTYDEKAGDPNDRIFPYHVKTTLKVGDQVIGVLSRLTLTADKEQAVPLIEVDFLDGKEGDPELVAAMSPELRESLVRSVGALRQFPFVQVNVPVAPVI